MTLRTGAARAVARSLFRQNPSGAAGLSRTAFSRSIATQASTVLTPRNMPLRAKAVLSEQDARVQSSIRIARGQRQQPMSTSASRQQGKPASEVEVPPQDEVVFASNYGVRSIELNRPAALNALNFNMARMILERLQEYEKSQLANVIVLKGAGPKAFCAGGDVVALVRQNQSEEGIAKSCAYFALEYTLDHLIATYSKPVVAFIDGFTIGGGVGLSVHAPFRVATERTRFSMPETKIGFFTDVGGSFFLSRMDGELGTYLALTSEMLKGVDTLYAGVATHYVHSSSLPDLEARLAELQFSDRATLEEKYEIVDSTIEEFSTGLPDTPFSLSGEKRKLIDECFSQPNLLGVLQRLTEHVPTSPFIQKTLDLMHERCPLSILCNLALLRYGKSWSITEAFQREYVLASRFMRSPEFNLGVDHLLIQKISDPPHPAWTSRPLNEIALQEFAEPLLEQYFGIQEGGNDIRLPLGQDRGASDYRRYPHWWVGLPSEAEIKAKVDETVRGKRMTREEIVDWFVGQRRGKVGVKEKVKEVLARKTGLDQTGYAEWNA